MDAATGAAQWTYLAGDDLDASPAVADGMVFVAAVASTETNEETTRTGRRVLGGKHPLVEAFEVALREARAALAARETPSPSA